MPDNSVAGTAETMTDRDVRWLKLHISEEADITEYPLEGFEARALATYAALAEKTAECADLALIARELEDGLVEAGLERAALRASLAEAQRYGRSADSVIADLRDQLAAYSLFPVDAARQHATPEGTP